MLSVGQSHTPGTFIGFAFSEIAGITISLVMLPGKVFSRATAYVGMLGYSFLFIFEICKSFVPAFDNVALMVATVGGC